MSAGDELPPTHWLAGAERPEQRAAEPSRQLELVSSEHASELDRALEQAGRPHAWKDGYRIRTVSGEAALTAPASRLHDLVFVQVSGADTWPDTENRVLEQCARQLELLRGLVSPGCRVHVRVAVWLPDGSAGPGQLPGDRQESAP